MAKRVWIMAIVLAGIAWGTNAEEPFDFVQLCDPQLGAGGMEHDADTFRKAVMHINRLKPAFVIICGDFTDDSRDEAAMRTFKRIIGGFEMPCHLVPGNNDMGPGSGRTAIGQYKRRYGRDHYFFDHEDFRFVVVNTDLWVREVPIASARHDQWLEKILAEGKAAERRLIVAGHVPPYVFSVDEADDRSNLPLAKRLWLLDQFSQHDVRLMLAGHLHANLLRNHGRTLIAVSATTSINRDNQAMGFRLWSARADGTLDNKYIPVEGAQPPPEQAELARATLATILKQLKH